MIIGAGAAGLNAAYVLTRAGFSVRIVDPFEPRSTALWASGGMLAAGFEPCVELDDEALQAFEFARLCESAALRWPEFARSVEKDSGTALHFDTRGILVPFGDENSMRHCDQIAARAERLEIPFELLTADQIEALEPGLATPERALFFPNDGQVDNRALKAGLEQSLSALGRVSIRGKVSALSRTAGRVTGVELTDGRTIEADIVVLATGANPIAQQLTGIDITPVKGQMLALDLTGIPVPGRVVRAPSIYLAPKPDRLVVGATSEPGVDDLSTQEDAMEAMLGRADAVIPGLRNAKRLERWAGLRPFAPNAMPVIGEAQPGLMVSLGGYRNGVLLAPLMAQTLCQLLDGKDVDDAVRPFLHSEA